MNVGAVQEDRVGSKRISPAAALHGVPPLESFEAVEHPSEPVDLDQPVRCPPPEPSIMQVSTKKSCPISWSYIGTSSCCLHNPKACEWVSAYACQIT